MLSLRLPLGGPTKSEASPKVILAYGPSWRHAPGLEQTGATRFTPSITAGFKFDGDPILSLGPVDMARAIGDRLNAEAEADSRSGRGAIYVVAGLAAIGLAVWVVNDTVDIYEAFDELIDEDPPP
jgi:hypothetical protein